MNPETEHDVWCSADRRKPVGCEMCSCVSRRSERPMIDRLAEALRERNEGMCMEYCDLERDWDDLPPRTHDDKCAAVRALLAEYDAAQALDYRAVVEWISVEDGMPDDPIGDETPTQYQVFTNYGGKSKKRVQAAFYVGGGKWSVLQGCCVTHWMPLADPPIAHGKAALQQRPIPRS